MSDSKKEVIEKLKNGEFIAKTEPSLPSRGLVWQHLFCIKCSNNDYQPFVQCRLCNEMLSYSMSKRPSVIRYHVKKSTFIFSASPNEHCYLNEWVRLDSNRIEVRPSMYE
jgi:hypothetical protein